MEDHIPWWIETAFSQPAAYKVCDLTAGCHSDPHLPSQYWLSKAATVLPRQLYDGITSSGKSWPAPDLTISVLRSLTAPVFQFRQCLARVGVLFLAPAWTFKVWCYPPIPHSTGSWLIPLSGLASQCPDSNTFSFAVPWLQGILICALLGGYILASFQWVTF